MTKEEIAKYENKEPIAVYPISNWGGIEILDILYGVDDYVIWRYNFGEPEKKLHKAKIKYGPEVASIQAEGSYVRLDNCMRT